VLAPQNADELATRQHDEAATAINLRLPVL